MALRARADWRPEVAGAIAEPIVRELLWADLGRVTCATALELFEPARCRVRDGQADLLLLLEHEPVWTLGRNAPRGPDDPGALRVERGGRLTWHGPGQIVGYPVIARERGAAGGVRAFVAALEGGMIEVTQLCGVAAIARPEAPGVWVHAPGDWRKLGSVGISVRRGVTAHGFALNLDARARRGFGERPPCDIDDARATSLADEAGSAMPPFSWFAERLASSLAARLKRRAVRLEGGAMLARIRGNGTEGDGRERTAGLDSALSGR